MTSGGCKIFLSPSKREGKRKERKEEKERGGDKEENGGEIPETLLFSFLSLLSSLLPSFPSSLFGERKGEGGEERVTKEVFQ